MSAPAKAGTRPVHREDGLGEEPGGAGRDFLSTETGGAVVLLAAAVAALVWANSPWSDSYESFWTTKLSITLGSDGISLDLRHWVNEGLMTFFFLVVGLEARRELDTGELRERQRLAIPVAAALGGMAVPIAIFLAFNAGGAGAHGWGAAMSTDTALALGVLALLAPRGTRLRLRLLTLAVVDDLVALVVIARRLHGPRLDAAAAARGRLLRDPAVALRWVPFAWRTPGGRRARRRALGRAVRVGDRSARRRTGDRARDERLPARRATTSSARPSWPARSVSNRLPSSPAARSGASRRRSPPTSGFSTSFTRGRATSSCPCSRSRTPASTSTDSCSATPSARRSRSESSSVTSSASHSASSGATWLASRPWLRRPAAGPELAGDRRWRDRRGRRLHRLGSDLEPRVRRQASSRRRSSACLRRRSSRRWWPGRSSR